jgi:endonuclease-3
VSSPEGKPTKRPGPESLAARAGRAVQVLDRLEAEYPNAKIALDFTTPLELLIATILAAQARDSHINTVTPALFKKYRTAADWANAPLETLRTELRSTGTFNQKAKSVHEATQGLVDHHGGEVPDDLDALTQLHGVGRKTANVVIGNAFGHPDRVAVDTHVKRLSQRLRFTRNDDPDKIEADLEKIWPAPRRTRACHLLQFHGRRICDAKNPKCDACVVSDHCPSAFTFGKKPKK